MKRAAAIATLLFGLVASLDAYVLLGQAWPDGSVVMHLQLGSSGGSLIDGSTSWGKSAESALAEWNSYVRRVQFQVVRDSTAPTGDGNGTNNVFWSSSIYGRAFGSSTLAVTTNWSRGTTRTEADVIFNNDAKWSWNSYSGAPRASLIDFRRVALHEFGHVLGLNHPDQAGQSVVSIMHSSIDAIDRVQPDDIAGVTVLYGGGSLPPPTPTSSAPGPPTGLTTSGVGNFVSLSWRAPTVGTATRYIVEAGAVSGSANLANVSTGSTATTFTASNVGGGVYYVRVRAANSVGVSAPSNEAILVVGSACSGPPTAPTMLVGSAGGNTVTLSWSAAAGNPTSYAVEGGSGPGLSNLANSDTGSATTSLTAPGVGRGIYYVRVRGKNTCGVGPASNEIVVIVQ
jgi:hypothetical protein